MEDKDNVLAIPVVAEQTKVCKCCGKEKPISEFSRKGNGYRSICKMCERHESGASEKFKDFTSRELIEELRNRGYKGTLKKEIVEEIKL